MFRRTGRQSVLRSTVHPPHFFCGGRGRRIQNLHQKWLNRRSLSAPNGTAPIPPPYRLACCKAPLGGRRKKVEECRIQRPGPVLRITHCREPSRSPLNGILKPVESHLIASTRLPQSAYKAWRRTTDGRGRRTEDGRRGEKLTRWCASGSCVYPGVRVPRVWWQSRRSSE